MSDDIFKEYVSERFPYDASKRATSGVVHCAFGEKIKSCLRDPSSVDKNFRFMMKKNGFRMLDLPSLGMKDVLVVPVNDEKENIVEDTSVLGKCRKVVYVEDFFDTLQEVHSMELLHAGYRKTYSKVQSMYFGIPRSVVQEFVKKCSTCQLKKPQQVTAPLKPILARGFMSRLQIDLIDMRHLPDSSYQWILHGIDHWSKFNFGYAIPSKHATCVAECLELHLFPYFGVPRILHSDNGREFINKVIQQLLDRWHSNIQLVSGRPRHPQSQGVVERSHATLERKLTVEIRRSGEKSPHWALWLPRIMYSMNTQVHDTTGTTPYELVFGQKPRQVLFPSGTNPGVILEEELEADGVILEDGDGVAADSGCGDQLEGDGDGVEADSDGDESQTGSGGEESTNLEERAKHLATTEKHLQVRQKADLKYMKAAERMANRYNKKKCVESFVVGDKVSLRIPRIDRTSSDLPRLPCIIVDVRGGTQGVYRLRSDYGVLNHCYPVSELERYNGPLGCSIDGWEEEQRLSLRETARHQAPWNKFTQNTCKCTTGCSTKKCRCFRSGLSCSSHCHGGRSCSNKKYDETPATLKEQHDRGQRKRKHDEEAPYSMFRTGR